MNYFVIEKEDKYFFVTAMTHQDAIKLVGGGHHYLTLTHPPSVQEIKISKKDCVEHSPTNKEIADFVENDKIPKLRKTPKFDYVEAVFVVQGKESYYCKDTYNPIAADFVI
jgi:hypothetical protein